MTHRGKGEELKVLIRIFGVCDTSAVIHSVATLIKMDDDGKVHSAQPEDLVVQEQDVASRVLLV